MPIYLCCILCNVKNGYDVNQSFLLCGLCLNEMVHSVLDTIDIFCSSPLKTVFGKIGDTYQAYCHTYKTHAMATHHRGSGQPLAGDINAHKAEDTDIEQTRDFHVNTNDFEESDPNNPTRPTLITRKLDELH